ncbi:dimethyl sulfoxide reductase subunit A [Clostridium sp. AF32-12BH]|nr:dimethyl sulfoxide reductase subunit A [Clostridium sp. AF32-12BH]
MQVTEETEITKVQATETIRTTGRNNCGGRCVICVHMKDGKIDHLSTERPCDAPDGEIPLTACVRGMNYHKTYLGEDRLRYPMKRVGKRGEGKFERISWDEAVDIIASEWIRIRDTYGAGSRYVNYATGISALNRGNNLAKRLLNLDGGFLDYYNSYSTACIRHATPLMYGTNQTGHNPEDWLNAKLILLWGHNPEETKFDSITMHVLLRAKEKGIPIIVIDPRKNDTAMRLDAEWIPIRPATDSAMMDAMAWVIVQEKLQDQVFLDRCCLGFDQNHMPEGVDPSECYLSYLYGEKDGVEKTPEWAEAITGVLAETIRSLAIRYAQAKPAALIQGYGPQRNASGEQSTRGGILLACMTGNVGISGGWASGTADWTEHKNPSWPKLKNPYNRQIPVFLWTDAVLHGHDMTELDGVKWLDGSEKPVKLERDIKMILNLAGNCLINQHSDINRTARILQDESKCEFIVCSDLFMTASAKFADILLPGISMFECENITMPWQYGNFLGFNNKVLDPLYEGRFEYDWLAEVAERLGLKEAFTCGRTSSEWLEYLYEDLKKTETELPDYQTFKQQALFRYKKKPVHPAFEKECQDPDRVPFPTRSGKIEIFSEQVYRGIFPEFVPAIPRYIPPVEGPQDPLSLRYPLQLTGWHTKRRCHSIHDNNRTMHRLDPQTLWMNPADASARDLREGDLVEVFNDRGRIRMPVHITERIMQGVTAISQGAWYRPDEDGTDMAGSINVLTSQHPTPYARGNAQHTNLVEVVRIAQPLDKAEKMP